LAPRSNQNWKKSGKIKCQHIRNIYGKLFKPLDFQVVLCAGLISQPLQMNVSVSINFWSVRKPKKGSLNLALKACLDYQLNMYNNLTLLSQL